MNRTTAAPGLAALGLVSIAVLLAGCSAYDAAVHGSVETSYSNAAGFTQDHPVDASWLPADATSITVVDSTRAEDTTTIRYDAGTAPEGCESVPRQSSPTMNVEADVDIYAIDSVLLCGEWAIANDADHWVAWTPAAEAG